MKKGLLSLSFLLIISGIGFAQTINIVYNANLGTSTLGGGAAAKVYAHSGGGATPWLVTIGNWGLDDGIGLMTETADDIWELEIVADEYYTTPGVPVDSIGMVFRNEDGTLQGKSDSDGDIFAGLSADLLSYSSTCECVTIEMLSPLSVQESLPTVTNLNVGPNPYTSTVAFSYTLSNTENVKLVIYNMMGDQIATVTNETQVAGTHSLNWTADASLAAGNYLYRLEVGSDATSGSLIKL